MIGISSNRRLVKLEKPRPLKTTSMVDQSLETVLSDMDLVSQRLSSQNLLDKSMNSPIASLCENLRMFGPQLESIYKDQLDRCFVSLRNGCRDDRLSLASRYRLLEVIELRAMHWQANENLSNYYKQKLAQIEVEEGAVENQNNHPQMKQVQPDISAYINCAPLPLMTPTQPESSPMFAPTTPTQYPGQQQHFPSQQTPTMMYPPQHQMMQQQQQQISPLQHQTSIPATPQGPPPPPLNPGEVVKSSGKFAKPTRIAGKNYCKDEVVIRNADSGKVMGMKGRRVHLIEELSETIISFQRVAPGARERLVQITGPNEENISHAVLLIEETIRRNASPVRSEDEPRSSIYATHGGSTSSISSHTSDDALPGKRAHLTSGGHDDPLTEYKYTVMYNGEAIKITGSNLDLVRSAKLILDEHLNGETNITNGFSYADSPKKEQTSSSNSTKKSSLSPTHSPSPTSAVSITSSKKESTSTLPASNTVHHVEENLSYEAKGQQLLTVVRQPLIPSSSKEQIESVENVPQGSNPVVINRRAQFAKTSDDKAPDGETGGSLSSQPNPCVVYTRDFLITRSASKCAKQTPKDWASVLRACPAVIKKGSLHLTTLLHQMNEQGEKAVNSIPTYLKPIDLVEPTDFMNSQQKWSLVRANSNLDEEDNNGNTN